MSSERMYPQASQPNPYVTLGMPPSHFERVELHLFQLEPRTEMTFQSRLHFNSTTHHIYIYAHLPSLTMEPMIVHFSGVPVVSSNSSDVIYHDMKITNPSNRLVVVKVYLVNRGRPEPAIEVDFQYGSRVQEGRSMEWAYLRAQLEAFNRAVSAQEEIQQVSNEEVELARRYVRNYYRQISYEGHRCPNCHSTVALVRGTESPYPEQLQCQSCGTVFPVKEKPESVKLPEPVKRPVLTRLDIFKKRRKRENVE